MRSSILMIYLNLMILAAFGQTADLPRLPYQVDAEFIKLSDQTTFGPASAIALNSKGHIFVFHRGLHPLMEFDKDGNFVRSLANGQVSNAHGLRIDAQDNIWITDLGTHTVQKLDPQGRLQMILGKINDAGEWSERYNIALFNKPTDVAFDSDGDIFVADGYGNSRVVKFDKEGRFIKAWGKAGSGPGEFNTPHAIAVDKNDRVCVADRENKRIQIFDNDGKYVKELTHVGVPYGLFLTKDQTLFIADGDGHCVYKATLEGKILGVMGEQGKIAGTFGMPHFLHVDNSESIYVAEILNWRVQKFIKRDF